MGKPAALVDPGEAREALAALAALAAVEAAAAAATAVAAGRVVAPAPACSRCVSTSATAPRGCGRGL